jgi:predicted RNA methylase
MATNAFSPTGLTVSFTADTTAPTAVAAVSTAPSTRPAREYRVVNAGAETVLLGVGATAAAAQTAAVSIAAGAVPILQGAVEILGFPAGSFFTGDTASGTAVVYVTPGEGL